MNVFLSAASWYLATCNWSLVSPTSLLTAIMGFSEAIFGVKPGSLPKTTETTSLTFRWRKYQEKKRHKVKRKNCKKLLSSSSDDYRAITCAWIFCNEQLTNVKNIIFFNQFLFLLFHACLITYFCYFFLRQYGRFHLVPFTKNGLMNSALNKKQKTEILFKTSVMPSQNMWAIFKPKK